MADAHDDIVFDSASEGLDDSVVSEEYQGDTIKKLKERLKEAEVAAKSSLDELQRAKADFLNMRKRDEEDKQSYIKFATANLVEDLIPVLDALWSAVSHGDKGIEQTYNLLVKSLGLTEINPLGETFDPNFHEAIGVVAVDNKEEDNIILEVVQKGYILSGKTLRPAIVKIGEYKIGRN